MSKSIQKIISAFGIMAVILSFSYQKAEAKPHRNISLQVFYDELSYYGDWYNNPDYGYVWRPDVNRDFRPYYSNGHWVMTEYGNTWVSDYDWGWAPFHYGRWFYDRYDGWIWAPDTEWGPAWVTWRTGGGYYGWAPLAPRINININAGRRYYVPDNYWVFIPQRCIYYPSYSRYWEPRRNVYIVQNTTVINNIYTNRNVRYYTGPRADDIRRATRQDVPVYRIADSARPGSVTVDRSNVNIYRPDVSKDDKNAAPRTIANNNGRPSRVDNNSGRTNDSNSNDGRYNGNSNTRPETTDRPTRSSDDQIKRVDPMPSRDGNSNSNGTNRPDVSRTNPSSNGNSNYPQRSERIEPTRSTPSTSSDSRSSRPDVDRSSPSSNGNNYPQRSERTEPNRNTPPSSSDSRSSRPDVDRSSPSRDNTPAPTPSRSERPEPSRSTPSSSPSSSSRSNAPSGNSSRPSRSENTPTKSVERSAPEPSSPSVNSSSRSSRPTRDN
jgi:hypothetical protein